MRPLSQYESFKRALDRGVKTEDAAAIAGVSIRTAYRWKSKGCPGTAGRKANPRAAMARAKELVRIAKSSRRIGARTIPLYPTAPRIARRYREMTGIVMHATTCIRYLAIGGFRSYVRPRHPNLKNLTLRYNFARKWYRKCPKRLVFSDEHFISTNDNTNRRMYAPSRDAVLPRERQRRQNVPNFQIWAAVGYNFKSPLIFFPKTNPDDDSRNPGGFRLNAQSYVRRCLSKVSVYLAQNDVVFMQDGARCHWAKTVIRYLEGKGIEYMEGYPSNSPDLNPIESIWALLDKMIAERLVEQTEEALIAAARSAWDELDQETINAHVMSFRSKCRRLVASGGQ